MAKRLGYLLFCGIVFGVIAAPPAGAACGGGGGGLNAQEAGLLADFLILAVKPEGDERDYKLVEIGDTKVDAGLLGVVVNALPLGFLGLGSSERGYDETAELAQCRAACRANEECRDFSYVRPNASQPVGVCHLKRFAEGSSFGMMAPVTGSGDRASRMPEPNPIADKIVFEGSDKSGGIRYAAEDARPTPLTLKFLAPVTNVKVLIRAAEPNGQETWAKVDAFDAKGKLVKRTGTYISAGGELNFGHGIAVSGDSDRIAVVKISTDNRATLLVDAIEFARTFAAPPATPPREAVPPPPPLPPIVAEVVTPPARTEPTAPPRMIAVPPPRLEQQALAEPPLDIPTASQPTVVQPEAQPVRERKPLPVWLALGTVAFMFGGAGVYWHSHRKKILTRISTRLVSNGLDRHTVAIEGPDRPDIGLRFVVRQSAAVGTPSTRIDLVPAGAQP